MVLPVGSRVIFGCKSAYGVISFMVMSSSDLCFFTLENTSGGSALRLKWIIADCWTRAQELWVLLSVGRACTCAWSRIEDIVEGNFCEVPWQEVVGEV